MKKVLLTLLAFVAFTSVVYAQQAEVSGTVICGTTGDPLIGVAVFEINTQNGTTTDYDGKFSLSVQEGATISFSYMGYKTQLVKLGNESVLKIKLMEDTESLEELIVVGYGVQKKALVTGANLNVKGDKIAKLNTASAMEALQGVAPGLSVSRNNGAPGSGTKVNIRGIGTVGNSKPLYIVDGVETGGIDNINPLSIESIDVLKDAASAAIYGSRAANGVILVTTKKGRQNQKTQVSYSGYFGAQNLAARPSLLNAQEYMFIQDEMRMNDGLKPNDWHSILTSNAWLEAQRAGAGTEYGDYIWNNLQAGGTGTDWLSEMMMENAPSHSHNIDVRGGGSKSTYSFGVGYYNAKGLVGGDVIGAGYKRLDVRFNSDFILYETAAGRPIVTVGENITFTNTVNKSVAAGNQYWNDVYNAIRTNPLMPAYWEGSIDDSGIAPNLDGLNFAHPNPVASMYYNRSQFQDPKSYNVLGNAFIKIEPIKNLVIRSSFGVNASFGSGRSYSPTVKGFGTGWGAGTLDKVQQDMNMYSQYTWTNTASYKAEFGKHELDVLVGNEMSQTTLNMNVGGWKNGSLYNDLEHAYLANAPKSGEINEIDTYGTDWAAQGGGLLSYMARASYNYDDKYMLDATVRADGSSNFAPGNRWGVFPSFAAGWNFSEEGFLEDADWLSFGKLRASWGQNGNQTLMDQWGNYVGFVYTSNIATTGTSYYFGDNKSTASTASYPANVANLDVTWETSEQLNFGTDLRFLDSRLGLTFDWYSKTTKDWLVVAPILGTAGASAPFINGGEINNMGTEISLSWEDKVGDFSYGATASMYTNKNEVTKLESATGYMNGPTAQIYDNCNSISRVEVGMPIGYFYGYKTDGILQNQAEVDAWVNESGAPYFADARPGDIRFVDVTGDGVIDDKDRTMIGNPNPDITLGLQLNLDYKGIFLNATMTGEFGHQVFNGYFWGHSGDNNLYRNWTTEIFNRWTGEGTSDRIPRLSPSSHRNSSFLSDASIYDADYMRLTNLTVGYNFANLVPEQNWISNLTLYMTASNLCTITNYTGFDPDVAYGGEGASWASGVDLGLYPLPRTYMIGLNVTF